MRLLVKEQAAGISFDLRSLMPAPPPLLMERSVPVHDCRKKDNFLKEGGVDSKLPCFVIPFVLENPIV